MSRRAGLVLLVATAAMALLVAACGGGESASVEVTRIVEVESEGVRGPAGPQGAAGPEGPAGLRGPAGTPAPVLEVERSVADGVREEVEVATLGQMETAQRQVIRQASLSVEVEDVAAAVAQARGIVESLGGFVEQMSRSGDVERQRATMTLRVPQGQFFSALDRIEGLGEVQSEQVGSEDVTEEFIDLEARLKSAQREEESLLSLLERTESVTEILTVERELTRVRSEIERLQGRLNFLERRVDLATIVVSLSPPAQVTSEPPSASLMVEVGDVSESLGAIRSLVSSRDGQMTNVVITSERGEDRADLDIRVFAADFGQVLSFVEGRGDVLTKEVREGGGVAEEGERPEEPDSRISVTLLEAPSSMVWWIVGGSLAGGLAFILVLYAAYRMGRQGAMVA